MLLRTQALSLIRIVLRVLKAHLSALKHAALFKEHLSWIFENDCSCSVEYKGMNTSCKDLYLKVHRT